MHTLCNMCCDNSLLLLPNNGFSKNTSSETTSTFRSPFSCATSTTFCLFALTFLKNIELSLN